MTNLSLKDFAIIPDNDGTNYIYYRSKKCYCVWAKEVHPLFTGASLETAVEVMLRFCVFFDEFNLFVRLEE